jgi:hypothetical protein
VIVKEKTPSTLITDESEPLHSSNEIYGEYPLTFAQLQALGGIAAEDRRR